MVMLAVLYSLWKAADSPLRLVGGVQLDKGLMQHFRDERPAPLTEISFFYGVLFLSSSISGACFFRYADTGRGENFSPLFVCMKRLAIQSTDRYKVY
jgi:hypothetical protein